MFWQWRWHPTKKKFEIFARGLSNPWGFDFNDVGQGFATCCVIPHLFHVVQGGTYHKQSKPHLNPYIYDYIPTIRDHTHLSAHGGARFYLADAFPAKYRDQLFMCNIHQHQLLTDVMKPKGSSYIGSHGEDFISMNDLAWVGFSLETGPEGGVYILDWHDTDVCGNAINFPNSGRIYRVMPKGARPIKRPNVGAMSDAQLVGLQNHANDWYVRQARLHLQMRAASGKLGKQSATRALEQLLVSARTSGKRLRALWALHVIGSLDEKRLHELLSHRDEYLRAFAIQFLMEDKKPSAASQARLASMARTDKSPVVRLYLASALQRLPHEQRWPILANLSQHTEDTEDNNIPRMLWFALEPMVPESPDKALQLAVNGKLDYAVVGHPALPYKLIVAEALVGSLRQRLSAVPEGEELQVHATPCTPPPARQPRLRYHTLTASTIYGSPPALSRVTASITLQPPSPMVVGLRHADGRGALRH